LRTLLVERKKIPRPKPCSGYIFTEAREFLARHYGEIPEEVRAWPLHIRSERLHYAKGRWVDVQVPGLNVWRDRFDAWLCRESGAEVWDGTTLSDFAEWSDRVELLLERNGKTVRLRTAVLIAADGGMSRVARKLDPEFPAGVPEIVTRHEYHACRVDLDPDVFHVFLNADYGVYPAVYAKDDLVVVDTSVRRGRKLRPARQAFHAMLREEFGFGGGRPAMEMGCRVIFPAARNRFCLGTGRVLVAGEAAGFMNALGEGISSALATGYLAGEAARGDGRGSPGEVYRE
ncbi:MAG: NAD(P)/FAD-dependent oxidoreductase, partial [Actinomycetota bacterium]|nr:NAD(P)/FAD-dependent oxidoreductase [Actinomycetota bacterium]